MQIAKLVFNSIQENTYILSDATGEAIIVDAGNSTERENEAISKFLSDNSLKPVMLVNTHAHVDHIVGINYLKERYGIPFAASTKDLFLIDAAPVHGRLYGFEIESTPVIDIDLANEDSISFGESVIEIIPTPGHSPGGICLYNRADKFLVTGDTLFKGSIGRTDLPGGDYHQLIKSILGKIIPLGGDVTIYPGHGAPSSIAQELESNPFITEVIEGEVNF